ncbi:MAG: Tyrosine recombinase XerC [Syntrophorhabdus sp. PtaB.Bin184]|nr:MAG: Tyrosine recombinase XerC [Syntrophorhabdus sp. PtaB.Bin184]
MGLYRKKGSNKWWMCFTANGVRYDKSTGTADKKLAGLIFADMGLKILKQEKLGVEPELEYTFDDMTTKFMDEYASRQEKSTKRRYEQSLKHLQPFFGGRRLSEIDAKLIDRYMQKRLKETSCRKTLTKPATVNREFSMLARAFTLAVSRKWQMAKVNPCSTAYNGEPLKLKENNERERYLINDEEERLLKETEGYLKGQLWEIVVVALYMGMREGEILKLKHGHVDLQNRKLTITKENSKNKVPRTIPIMSETVLEILKKRMTRKVVSIAHPQDSLVFTTSSGKRVSARNVQRDFRKACRKAGIEDFVFHDLRHTFGTWLAQNGVDIYTIARYMGHEDLESTKRYTHHNAESLRASIGTIEKMTGTLKAIGGRQSHDA